MMNNSKYFWTPVFDDTGVEVFKPEIWAHRALQLFEEKGVALNLVNRDWNEEFARFGDKLYIQAPLGFTAQRKMKDADIVIQPTRSKQVPVLLDQHLHTSFEVDDVDYTTSRDDLIAKYLEPAAISLANQADAIISYQCYQFMAHLVGQLGTTADRSTVVDIKTGMDSLNLPDGGLLDRICLMNNSLQNDLLNIENLLNANTVGDDGTALRRGHLGEKFGIQFFTSQKMPSISILSGTTFNASTDGAYDVGATAIKLTTTTSPMEGMYLTIDGDMVPHRVSAYDGGTLTVTLATPLAYAVADGALVTVYVRKTIAGSYPEDNLAPIVTETGFVPQAGQLVGLSGTDSTYASLGLSTATDLILERGLEEAFTGSGYSYYGPAGNYSLAFNPAAITLVNRPLAVPPGVMGYTANYNNLSMRFTFGYDMRQQKSIITVDTLCGVKVTNEDAGILILN